MLDETRQDETRTTAGYGRGVKDAGDDRRGTDTGCTKVDLPCLGHHRTAHRTVRGRGTGSTGRVKGKRSGKTARGAREWVRKRQYGTRRLALSIGNSERNRGPRGGRPCEERIVAQRRSTDCCLAQAAAGVAAEVERRCSSGRGCDLTLDDFGVCTIPVVVLSLFCRSLFPYVHTPIPDRPPYLTPPPLHPITHAHMPKRTHAYKMPDQAM